MGGGRDDAGEKRKLLACVVMNAVKTVMSRSLKVFERSLSRFSQKYEAIQLFSVLIIIRNVS